MIFLLFLSSNILSSSWTWSHKLSSPCFVAPLAPAAAEQEAAAKSTAATAAALACPQNIDSLRSDVSASIFARADQTCGEEYILVTVLEVESRELCSYLSCQALQGSQNLPPILRDGGTKTLVLK